MNPRKLKIILLQLSITRIVRFHSCYQHSDQITMYVVKPGPLDGIVKSLAKGRPKTCESGLDLASFGK
jgi:hypothetical protein